jgi:3-phenylpropionate/trans-cinnamate dioxygenase ferredoxin reductase component
MPANIVIVGGGLAAAKAAQAARESGYEGRLTIFGDEPVHPYERPPLSKGYLSGKAPEDDIYVHSAAFYDEHAIELRLDTPITAIDRSAGEVVTAAGTREPFDRLLLATGAEPRTLPSQTLDGVVVLRTKADSDQLRTALQAVSHVTIVGAGWIGCEVAAAARSYGTAVTMIDPLDVPLQRVLGTKVGAVFAGLHVANGVDLRLGVGLTALHGTGSVEAVELSDGARIPTELVVVGIGVVPRTGLAEGAGLAVDNGVLTDATLQTDDERIFAAGDVARSAHPLFDTPIRVEHWANALNQGTTAGRNLLGTSEPYDRLPYFFSDQYDLGMEYVGYATEWDDVVLRGDVNRREFVAFWVKDDRVVAAMNCNVWDVVEDLKTLITSRTSVSAPALQDPSTPLAALAAQHA